MSYKEQLEEKCQELRQALLIIDRLQTQANTLAADSREKSRQLEQFVNLALEKEAEAKEARKKASFYPATDLMSLTWAAQAEDLERDVERIYKIMGLT
jgi:hypothetical protein